MAKVLRRQTGVVALGKVVGGVAVAQAIVRPHRSLGYITPNEFAQDEVGEKAQGQCRALGRATPSLRPSIDLLYDIEQIINPSRLTKALDQFG